MANVPTQTAVGLPEVHMGVCGTLLPVFNKIFPLVYSILPLYGPFIQCTDKSNLTNQKQPAQYKVSENTVSKCRKRECLKGYSSRPHTIAYALTEEQKALMVVIRKTTWASGDKIAEMLADRESTSSPIFLYYFNFLPSLSCLFHGANTQTSYATKTCNYPNKHSSHRMPSPFLSYHPAIF